MRVYAFQVGHYKHLWTGPVGVVVAKNVKSAREQLEKLCGADDAIHKLDLVSITEPGIHKLEYDRWSKWIGL